MSEGQKRTGQQTQGSKGGKSAGGGFQYQKKQGGQNQNKGGEGGPKYQPKGQQKTYGDGAGKPYEGAGEGGNRYQQKQGFGGKNHQGGKKPYQKYGNDEGGGRQSFKGKDRGQNKGGYQKNYGAPMKQEAQSFFPHQQNLQQMDQSELQELLMTVITNYGPEIANASGQGGQGGAAGLQALLSGLGGMNQGGGGYNNRGQGNYHNRGSQYKGGNQQSFGGNSGPNDAMQNLLSSMGGMQNSGADGGFPSLQPDPSTSMPAPVPINTTEEVPKEGAEEAKVESDGTKAPTAMAQQQQLMNNNLCEKHFPEPVIYMSDQPMCRKCVPEYMDKKNKAKKNTNRDSEQSQMLAKMFGFSQFGSQATQLYKSEQNQIEKTLLKLDDFRGDFRFLNEEIEERAQESMENLENLPELMCQIFAQSEKKMAVNKTTFLSEIDEIIEKQSASFKKDNETKVPNFYERLSQKYSQLQQATSFADQTPQEELLEILDQYSNIFMDLDAEFEKYFNEFENASKLQRLMDKDQTEIIKNFTSLIETNLRVDYNVKNSFQPGVPSRVHSFQWNQKFAYVFKVHNAEFEKRPVQMEFEVPLYSRSIATEDGGIYLIGGCNKRRNQYLKKCYRYNEIFANLEEKASMVYPHADHSLCAIEGFIYVVGTFVNSQVYGFCEVYDIQKDQWKQIDSLRVARSGVALSAFKNNYIFAFGGRVDQKNIVDTIECYNISKNVWQEIQSPSINKQDWIPGYMSLAYQITDNEILIFGGKSALTFLIFNGCFVLDVEKMEIKEKGKLVNPCSFMNTPLVFGGNLYAFGNDIYIHKYKIAEQQWVCIPKAFP